VVRGLRVSIFTLRSLCGVQLSTASGLVVDVVDAVVRVVGGRRDVDVVGELPARAAVGRDVVPCVAGGVGEVELHPHRLRVPLAVVVVGDGGRCRIPAVLLDVVLERVRCEEVAVLAHSEAIGVCRVTLAPLRTGHDSEKLPGLWVEARDTTGTDPALSDEQAAVRGERQIRGSGELSGLPARRAYGAQEFTRGRVHGDGAIAPVRRVDETVRVDRETRAHRRGPLGLIGESRAEFLDAPVEFAHVQ
jgi:hypothetical protein